MTGKEPEILVRAANAFAGSLFALIFLLTATKHVLARTGHASVVLKWAAYAAITLAVLHGCQAYVRTGEIL